MYNVIEIRFSSGFSCLVHFSIQILSLGEFPTTTATFFGVRQYPQNILDGTKKIEKDRDRRIFVGKSGIPYVTIVRSRQNHGRRGKEFVPVPLDKAGRGSADTHNQIGPLVGIDGTKIVDECAFRICVAEPGNDERELIDIQRRWRLPV